MHILFRLPSFVDNVGMPVGQGKLDQGRKARVRLVNGNGNAIYSKIDGMDGVDFTCKAGTWMQVLSEAGN